MSELIGQNEPEPILRQFHITLMGGTPEAAEPTTVVVEGSGVRMTELGALEVVRWAGDNFWMVAVFAPGTWAVVQADVPSADAVEQQARFVKTKQRDAGIREALTSLPGGQRGGRSN